MVGFGVGPAPLIWRVSRAKYPPLQIPPLFVQGTGRFDAASDSSGGEVTRFGVLYCGESPTASFLEVLAPLRQQLSITPQIMTSTIMDVEERDATNALISNARALVSNRWQAEWVLTSGRLTTTSPVFDLVDPGAVQLVRDRLALTLLALELSDLDFSHILGSNRALTRAISRWVWSMTNDAGQPLFSGIRYRSRFDPECICLALYQDRYAIEGEINILPIAPDTPGFAEAATILRLEIG